MLSNIEPYGFFFRADPQSDSLLETKEDQQGGWERKGSVGQDTDRLRH